MKKFEAIVTAGGTIEPIDDVRVITNLSTGRFGHAIAAELGKQGIDTTLLCPDSTLAALGLPEGVEHERFTTAESLKELMLDEDRKSDIVFHAAAVSDYTPLRTTGKISSDQDRLQISLTRNPKIIAELREHYGPNAFITGFKLLSNVPEVELLATATKLLRANQLDMVVANDLQQLQGDQHPVKVVTARDEVISFSGERQEVARQLVGFSLSV